MATYQTLQFSSFTDLVVPFETYNGINQISTGTQTITGYTLDLTSFTFTPILSALDNTYFGVSLDKMIWDFGDGTTATGYSVNKRYEYPGEYTVTTIFTDQNGVTHRNRFEQKIEVYNYIPDAIQWYTPTIAGRSTTGYTCLNSRPLSTPCGVPSEDLTLYRYNSWQSWPMVSGDGGYYINLYAQGSRSAPLTPDTYWNSADIHLTPTWRFVKSPDSPVPLDRVQTDTNQHIHVKLVDGQIVHTTADDPQSVFAGTSGTTTVNYIDDTSNRITSARDLIPAGDSQQAVMVNQNSDSQTGSENKDIILFASFDTSRFPITPGDENLSSFETLKQDYFQVYEAQKVGLPIIIKFNKPTQLQFTSNGISSFPINSNKYINSPFSLTARVAGATGDVLCTPDVVPLSSRWLAPSIAFSGGDITTDVLTAQGFVNLYLSGSDSTFKKVVTGLSDPDVDFNFWDVGEVVPEIGEDGVTTAGNTTLVLQLAERLSDADTTTPSDGQDTYNKRYRYIGRAVTLLPTQLSPASYDVLHQTDQYELTTVAREWLHESGRTYYGTVAPSSKYNTRTQTLLNTLQHPELTIDVTDTDMFASLLTIANINVDWASISANNDNKYRFFAETKIDPPLYFNHDVLYYYLTNSTTDTFHQIKPVYYREYSYGDAGSIQTYTPPITTRTPGNSGLYGFAVDPCGGVIMVDGDTDKIIRYYGDTSLRHEIEVYTLLPEVSAFHYPGDPDHYGYSPSSVCLDGNLDYWVTLYDTVSTVKIDGETNQVIACAVPPVNNYLANVRQVTPSEYWSASADYDTPVVDGVMGEYGENLINPTSVETCKNNDIIVTYSNTLCSFVVRYDSDGRFLYKFDVPGQDQYFPGDVCVDVSDHAWVVAEETGLNNDGTVNLSPPRGRIYSLDEQLQQRLVIDSVSGAAFQDMKSPVPSESKTIQYNVLVSTDWNYVTNSFEPNGLLLEDFSLSDVNPEITLYEGNTYVFKSMLYNNGQHPLQFREIASEQQSQAGDMTWDLLSATGDVVTQNVSADGDTLSIYISSSTPGTMLLVDENYHDVNRLVARVIPKPQVEIRPEDSLELINNPTHVIPDNANHIWFSWGSRYCSRYNTFTNRVDTTVAVGSAFHDPRYSPLSADTHERRDNADRRSAIEGLAFDTANNLLVINNADKRLYAINSETPTASAYVNISNYQTPYGSYNWVDSVSGESQATESDFLMPTSYLTDEQIQVFLRNVLPPDQEITQQQRQQAFENYALFLPDADAVMISSVDTTTGLITLNFTNTDPGKLYTISVVGPTGEPRVVKILTMDGDAHASSPTFTATLSSHVVTVRATAQMDWVTSGVWNETSRVWDTGVDYDWLSANKDTAITFTSTGGLGNFVFRESHGAPGAHDVGFEQDIRAGGDWTGWKWINKYDERPVLSDSSTGFVSISGASDEFQLLPRRGTHDISKVNEHKDFAGVLREYIMQSTLRDNPVFYDEFLNTVFGTTGSDQSALGKRIYERISNYVMNHADIDTATIKALKGMAELVNYKLVEFGSALPSEMQRVVDLLSIKFSKLRGTVTDYQDDFEKYGNFDQKSIGVNLGSELMFIYDYDSSISYGTHDFVRYNDEYYQSLQSVPAGVTPPVNKITNEHWRHWPDGEVRSQHLDQVTAIMNRMFSVHKQTVNYLEEFEADHGQVALEQEKQRLIMEQYNEQPVRIKLIDRLFLQMDDQYVVKNDTSEQYSVVTVMGKSWDDQLDYQITMNDQGFSFSGTNSAATVNGVTHRYNEYLSDISQTNGLITIDDNNVLTLMGASDNTNPTVVLFRDRSYRLNIETPGHPIEIMKSPGVSGERLQGFVSEHDVEFGTIVLRTATDLTYGDIPSILYYQSTSDPTISGVIEVRDVSTVTHYSNEFQAITGYNIDLNYSKQSQLETIGWGLDAPPDDIVWRYYTLYEYLPQANKSQTYVNNVIDWDDTTHTTINFNDTLSDDYYTTWTKNQGDMDIIIEKTLREGLEMFDGMDSIETNFTRK